MHIATGRSHHAQVEAPASRWRRFLEQRAAHACVIRDADQRLLREGARVRSARRRHAVPPWLMLSLTILASCLYCELPAYAALATDDASTDSTGSGALMLRTADGRSLDAPRVDTQIRVVVTGNVVRAFVTQDFVNPTDQWLEGLYAFPLSATAAVDALEMRVGERIVRGQIREREAARRVFVHAAAEGKRASLVEQQRPNFFTTAVANIGPRAAIRVTIGYLDTVDYRDGQYRLHLPLAVTPRYQPGDARSPAGRTAAVREYATDANTAATRLDPMTVLSQNVQPGAQRASVAVELQPGFTLARLDSPHHAIRTEQRGRATLVTLADGAVAQDRDFELEWAPTTAPAATAAAFTQRFDGETYALVSLLPPLLIRETDLPREVIFIIDTSGSMSGPSIEQARSALQLALRDLDERDSFNVIRFSDSASSLYPGPVVANAARLREAHAYVGALDAHGGTEMRSALELALAMPIDAGKLRQIVFITDGAVSNESEIIATLRAQLATTRLFTVGIGAAPNADFLHEAAAAGRGSYTFIANGEQVVERMSALLAKLSQPALTDLQLHWPNGATADLALPLPGDLYVGDPITVVARLAEPLVGTLTLTGRSIAGHWTSQVPIDAANSDAGIAKLWGRERIRALERATTASNSNGDARAKILSLAMRHHLVSTYTSLVAVDETPVVPTGATKGAAALPATPPVGSAWATTGFARTATPAPAWFGLGFLFVLLGVLISWTSSARRSN